LNSRILMEWVLLSEPSNSVHAENRELHPKGSAQPLAEMGKKSLTFQAVRGLWEPMCLGQAEVLEIRSWEKILCFGLEESTMLLPQHQPIILLDRSNCKSWASCGSPGSWRLVLASLWRAAEFKWAPGRYAPGSSNKQLFYPLHSRPLQPSVHPQAMWLKEAEDTSTLCSKKPHKSLIKPWQAGQCLAKATEVTQILTKCESPTNSL
jgi:hypothetical protein